MHDIHLHKLQQICRIFLQRKSFFYIINLVLPCYLLSLIACFNYLLPPGKKYCHLLSKRIQKESLHLLTKHLDALLMAKLAYNSLCLKFECIRPKLGTNEAPPVGTQSGSRIYQSRRKGGGGSWELTSTFDAESKNAKIPNSHFQRGGGVSISNF